MNPTQNQSLPATGAARPKSVRVLFADDDEQFRVGLARRLQRAGFDCDLASTGDEAIAKLAEAAYDVLLADSDMPGNQSLELIDGLAAVNRTIPAVLLTGRPTVDTATRSVALKVAAYLVKPPNFDELCRTLNDAAAIHRDLRILADGRTRLQDWEKEIARLQQLLEQSSTAERPHAMRSFLRLTLRNLVVSLVELEGLLDIDNPDIGTGRALERHELTRALRKTVAVLDKTRGQFKSKDLGALRKEIETLLG